MKLAWYGHRPFKLETGKHRIQCAPDHIAQYFLQSLRYTNFEVIYKQFCHLQNCAFSDNALYQRRSAFPVETRPRQVYTHEQDYSFQGSC